MPYRDTMVTCEDCGKEFVYGVEMQRRQDAQGKELTPPDLCPTCRGAEPKESVPTHSSKKEKVEETVALGPGPHEGIVKWYDDGKGYGFVAHPDGAEIFFHRTGIAPGEEQRFPDGSKVTFLIEQTEKGPQAVDVARMDADD